MIIFVLIYGYLWILPSLVSHDMRFPPHPSSHPPFNLSTLSQVAFDRLTEASASQQACALTQAADQRKSFDDQLAKAAQQSSDQRVRFDDELAQAKLDAGCMQHAFDKLTQESAEQNVSFGIKLASARSSVSSMKVGGPVFTYFALLAPVLCFISV